LEDGSFRKDIFYRLNVLSLEVPPLRERGRDVLDLWNHFICEAAEADGRQPPATGLDVGRVLIRHPWPGNIRELQNAARHVVTGVSGREIKLQDLPAQFAAESEGEVSPPSLVGMTM